VLAVGHAPGFWDPALRAAALAKLGRNAEAREAAEELLTLKPDIGNRIRHLLSYTVKQPDVIEDFLDGLRTAGSRIAG
jgi:hypothetical protein